MCNHLLSTAPKSDTHHTPLQWASGGFLLFQKMYFYGNGRVERSDRKGEEGNPPLREGISRISMVHRLLQGSQSWPTDRPTQACTHTQTDRATCIATVRVVLRCGLISNNNAMFTGVTSHRQPRQCRGPRSPKRQRGPEVARIMYQDCY